MLTGQRRPLPHLTPQLLGQLWAAMPHEERAQYKELAARVGAGGTAAAAADK